MVRIRLYILLSWLVGAGWPYTSILKKLEETPNLSPTDLAITITQDYGQYYEENGDPINDKSAPQSALDLTRLQPVANSVSELANILIKNIEEIASQVILAREKAQKFEQPEYIDLISFLKELTKWLPQNKEVIDVAAGPGPVECKTDLTQFFHPPC